MKIWICNPFDVLPWEGGAQRYATLAASLAEQGHTVVHWSSGFSHSFKKRRTIPEDFRVEALPYAIELVDCPAYYSNVSLRRLWNHYQYGKGLVREGRRAVTDGRHTPPDLILASMPPMEGPAAALKLKQHFGCKVVLDVMDAWPQALARLPAAAMADGKWRMANAILQGFGRIALWPYYNMLRRACREADAVCAQSQAFADYARSFGATGEIPVFYLGAKGRDDCPDTTELVAGQSSAPLATRPPRDPTQKSIDPPTTTRTAPSSRCYAVTSEGSRPYLNQSDFKPKTCELKTGQPTTVELQSQQSQVRMLRLLYLGSMGQVYDLPTLIEAALHLLGQGVALRLDLVGEGEQRAALEQRVQAAEWQEAIAFHGYLSGGALAEVMASADVGVVPMHPESQVAVPYKACDYLAAHLPLVNSLPGELESKLNEYGCGRSYQVGNVESLIEALRPWLESAGALAKAKAGAGRLFEAHFDAAKIYPEYAAWVVGA